MRSAQTSQRFLTELLQKKRLREHITGLDVQRIVERQRRMLDDRLG